MWSFLRLAIVPVIALLITVMAAISMPLANADTASDPGRYTCALGQNGRLRYAVVPAECGYQPKSAALRRHHHQPPVLADIESAALRYAAGAPPVRVTQSLTVTSAATGTVGGATVRVSSGFTAGQDVLAFTRQSGITGSYSATSGVLTLTGTAPASAYATALRSVTYRDPAAATPAGPRVVSFQVSDGEPDHALSNVESRTVRVARPKPPVAVDDTATTGKNAAVTINVLAKDTDPAGLPLSIASVNTAGTRGLVAVDPNQTIRYNPNGRFAGLAAGQTATDTFAYTVTDGIQTSNPATVTVTITGSGGAPQPPTVTSHSYTAVGNTPLGVGTTPAAPAATVSGTVLSGDSDPDPAAALSVTAATAPAHGTVTVNPDGTFTYLPDPGYTGTDSFQAAVAGSDAPAVTATETVTITVGTVVWYVDDSVAAAGNGQAGSPFNTLAAANAAAGADSVIFLYQGGAAYTGVVGMQPGEDLWGQPHGLTAGGYSLVPAGGSTPAITNSCEDGIDLADGADVEGVSVLQPTAFGCVDQLPGIKAVNVDDATVGATSTVSIGGGVEISGGDGNLNFGDDSVDGPSGVSVAGRSGGTVTFGGPVAGGAVTLTDNTGATIAFTGPLTPIEWVGSPYYHTDGAFVATGGGTVTATGAGSALSGLLIVRNTTIGAAGLTFQSVSGSNEAAGISLDSTGSSGSLTVTGTGTPGSGGGIAPFGGQGVTLISTYAPSLTDMEIQGGITGSEVDGLTLAGCTVPGGLLGDLTGNVSITNSTFTGPVFRVNGSFGDDAAVSDTSGTLHLTITGNTFTGTQSGIGNDGLAIDADGTANAPASVTGTVSGNTIGAPTVAGSGGGTGIDISAEGSATETLAITGNHLYQYSNGAGIGFVNSGGNPAMNLTITGNTIADPGADASHGIYGQAGAQAGDNGTVCAAIAGNSATGSGLGGGDVELDQNYATTYDLPGYTGAPEDTSAVESFLIGNNDGSGTPTAVATVSGSGGGFAGVTGC